MVFPVSRLICDVESSSDDDEPMAIRGMGAIYTSTSMGTVLRDPPTAPRAVTLIRSLVLAASCEARAHGE
jgi:N-formylglutamate deformylase